MLIPEIDKIICRDVHPNVQATDSRFELRKTELLAELMEPGALETIAIHEAGHEHYYKLAGGYDFSLFLQ